MEPSEAIRVSGEAAEVAPGRGAGGARDGAGRERRGRLADVVAAVDDGEIDGADADALAELLELGLDTGRVRAVYGPEGEQAALALFRRLPLGKELTAVGTRPERGAGRARAAARSTRSPSTRSGRENTASRSRPTDYELVLRLGRAGARLATIGA